MLSSYIAKWSLTTNSTLILDSAGTITWGSSTDDSVASISGSGALLVDGGNLVSFYPTNSYTGGTTVRSGILRIQASNLLPANGDVVVESAGIFDTQTYSQTVKGLSGNGTVKMGAGISSLSTNTVNGTLAPGLYGAGTLTLSDPGIFVLGASSTSLFELNGLNGINDQVVMSYPTAAYTGLELAGTLEVENLGGLEVGAYTLFDLNSGPISGSFSSINMPRSFLGAVNITSGDVVLEVKNLTTKYKPKVENVSFTLHKGEILGIGGLVGSRRTELVEAIFGARTIESGELILDGEKLNIKHPVDAISHKFALITEERRRTGIYPVASIRFNTTIANVKAYRNKFGLLQERRLIEDTDKQIKNMRIKTPHQLELIRALSGGNQQKVIIGRWLLTDPNILIMDEPTRGIDVGAKFEIYQLMIKLIERGKSIIMVSSEMPELLGVTHRIAIMSNGKLAGIVNTHETSQEEIFRLSAKYL
jgi:ABC-type multidrug transport system ATPase subunit